MEKLGFLEWNMFCKYTGLSFFFPPKSTIALPTVATVVKGSIGLPATVAGEGWMQRQGMLLQETKCVVMRGNWKGGDKFLNTWRKRYMPHLKKIFLVDGTRK